MIITVWGEVISLGDELTQKHKWRKYHRKEWECIKCDIIKREIGYHEIEYVSKLNGDIMKLSPKCINSNVRIIKDEKTIKKSESYGQFELFS